MKKHSTYSVFLLILLIITLLLGIMGNYTMISKSREKTEMGFKSALNEERLVINERLDVVSETTDLLAEHILLTLDDPSKLLDSDFEQSYTDVISQMINSAISNSEDIIAGYIRYNPDIYGPTLGTFLMKTADQVQNMIVTDFSQYDSNDIEHVGWYYLPVSFGEPVWMDPYKNNNINIYMISYVVPLIKDGETIGIIGFDVNIEDLCDVVNEINLCNGGYAVLKDKTGNILNENNIKEIEGEVYSQTVLLANGMELSYYAPVEEIFELRYSTFFQVYMCLYIGIFLFVFISIFVVMIVRGNRERTKHEGIWHMSFFKWLFMFFAVFVFLIQIMHFLLSYRNSLEIKYNHVSPDNTYEETIKVTGISDFAPYAYIDENGNYDGFDIELISEIANRLQLNLDITLKSYEKALESIEKGDAQILLGYQNIANDNIEDIICSDITSDDDYSVFGKHSIMNIQELANSSIGIVNGDTPVDILGLQKDASVYKSGVALMDALETGEVDFAIVRGGTAHYFIRQLGYEDIIECYEIMDNKLSMAVNIKDEALSELINDALRQMKEDGTYDIIYKRWLGEEYDNDFLLFIRKEKYFLLLTALLFLVFASSALVFSVISSKDRQLRQKQNLMNELQLQSDIDELTRLYNRHAYEVKLRELRLLENIKDITVVALDVNGLKETNDNKGHAVGDELLKGASRCIEEAFKEYGECYRTGGDEFIAILDKNAPASELLSARFNAIISQWKSAEIDKISVSFGIVDSNEYPMISIDEMIEAADQLMYADKVAYYQQSGIDRRGQQSAYGVLKDSYLKILKVNLTLDIYSIIQVDAAEMTKKRGYSEKISGWFKEFASSGQVHPEDRDFYLQNVDIEHLKEFFKSQKSQFCIQYRRRVGEIFSSVMLEMMKAPEYTDENQVVFLFVKNTAPVESYKGNILSSTDLRNELKRREEVEKLIRMGLENEYFYMMYQPQFTAKDKKLRGFESLIRLTMPDGTRMSPAEFIPDAENTDLIMDIDNYVLERVMKDLKDIVVGTNLIVSVNMSVKSISSKDFVGRVKGMIATCGYPAANLELEITEYTLMDDDNTVFDNITELRAIGVKIALDDFGTGYTSLSQMVRIPFDLLKMDKSLVDDIENNNMKREFSNAVIELGHLVDSEVIAEGVEKDEQLEILKTQGCDFIQGYIWGKPMIVEDAISLAQNN